MISAQEEGEGVVTSSSVSVREGSAAFYNNAGERRPQFLQGANPRALGRGGIPLAFTNPLVGGEEKKKEADPFPILLNQGKTLLTLLLNVEEKGLACLHKRKKGG